MPSTTLIDILRRRLLDPSIVPAFERRRAHKLTGGLVRPRWVLIPASEGSDAAAAAAVRATDVGGVLMSLVISINSLPRRTIDQ